VGANAMIVNGIWHIIRRRAKDAGITSNITPHSTRVCFITLALKGCAALHKVQYAAGHADPRTTERNDRE
jgi:site-specific recombinase XerD